jgi:hypothetical protein
MFRAFAKLVGHTDDVGQESANVTLSNSRAEAVVSELTGPKYKIAKNRLKSAGVGPYVPVASNKNEQGRAKNRRVVLVEDVPWKRRPVSEAGAPGGVARRSGIMGERFQHHEKESPCPASSP